MGLRLGWAGRPRLYGLGTGTWAIFSLFFPSFCLFQTLDCMVALLGVLCFHFSSFSFRKFILRLPFQTTPPPPSSRPLQRHRTALGEQERGSRVLRGDFLCSGAIPLGNSPPSHSAVTFPSSLRQLLCRLASLCSPARVTPLQGLRAPMHHARGQLAGWPLSRSSFRRVVRSAKTLGPRALSKPHTETDPALLTPACSSATWR